MAVDYDLVIIGATAAARVAAIEAVNLRARVALVLPQSQSARLHPQRGFYPYALAQIAKTDRTDRSALQQPSGYPWKYALAAIDKIEQQSSFALLATMGVDTLVGDGEFCRLPHLAFNIGQRYLRARAYIVATGSEAAYPLIPGIQEVGYVTIDNLTQMVDRERVPSRWAIIGAEAIGVELAQTLARLGCQVSLIVESPQILPYEDLELASPIQAQLEADGVRVYLEGKVTNIELNNTDKLVTVGEETIAVDEIFIALPERPLVEPFNLVGVGIEYDRAGISIDNKLQTSHPQIYACGSVCGNVTGGYRSDSLMQYEAKLAVRNALSRRKTQIDYQSYNNLPWAVYTDPPLARVGIPIGTALNNKHQKLIVLSQYLKTCSQAILTNSTAGFCQIAVTRTGQIKGAEIVGRNAPELIQILAFAIRHRIKIAEIATMAGLSPSYTEFIYQTAQQWYAYHRTKQPKRTWIWRLSAWWRNLVSRVRSE
jgi:pyruvate/2-oxoglutarate dehydrogenase complex dihydrolipoamide dehydrogenase (E3) component